MKRCWMIATFGSPLGFQICMREKGSCSTVTRLFLQQVPKRVMKKEGLSQRAEPRTERVGLRVMVDNLQEIYSYEMSLGKMLHS